MEGDSCNFCDRRRCWSPSEVSGCWGTAFFSSAPNRILTTLISLWIIQSTYKDYILICGVPVLQQSLLSHPICTTKQRALLGVFPPPSQLPLPSSTIFPKPPSQNNRNTNPPNPTHGKVSHWGEEFAHHGENRSAWVPNAGREEIGGELSD
jgi:hypothetical protein